MNLAAKALAFVCISLLNIVRNEHDFELELKYFAVGFWIIVVGRYFRLLLLGE